MKKLAAVVILSIVLLGGWSSQAVAHGYATYSYQHCQVCTYVPGCSYEVAYTVCVQPGYYTRTWVDTSYMGADYCGRPVRVNCGRWLSRWIPPRYETRYRTVGAAGYWSCCG